MPSKYSGVWTASKQMQKKNEGKWPNPKIISISPSVNGKSTWDFDTDGPLDLSTAGTWTVIPTVSISINAKLWGAAGGSGISIQGSGSGGAGGYASGTLTLVSGTTYTIIVGDGGSYGGSGSGYPGGGYATYPAAGCGGGYSVIRDISDLILAGAGGGGGANDAGTCGRGGPGGGSTGVRGSGGYSTTLTGGYGGTQNAGGNGGCGNHSCGENGNRGGGGYGGIRGTNGGGGGGGGGGFYGGGGGGGTSYGGSGSGEGNSGGGGGGSSFYRDNVVTSGYLEAGNLTQNLPGNYYDPVRGTAGNPPLGNSSADGKGFPGKVYITAA